MLQLLPPPQILIKQPPIPDLRFFWNEECITPLLKSLLWQFHKKQLLEQEQQQEILLRNLSQQEQVEDDNNNDVQEEDQQIKEQQQESNNTLSNTSLKLLPLSTTTQCLSIINIRLR